MHNFYAFKIFLKHHTCHHLVTQKNINAPYSFSFALHTQEEALKIKQNRYQIQMLYPQMHFIVANQTHSANIHIVQKKETRGWENLDTAIQNCDALITNKKNIMLTVLTADCVPILLFDPIKNVIASVHAGWKGTKEEILFKTVKKMEAVFKSKPKNILAGIAPSIGACCYEVDWNVAQNFQHINKAYQKEDKKYKLNLPHINKLQLLNAKLNPNNIEMSNICTACEVDTYFSYRQESACTGRFMSMIGLSESQLT